MHSAKRRVCRVGSAVISLMIIIIISYFAVKIVKADDDAAISVQEINYQKSTITLKVNDDDTEVYFSDYKKKSWEEVPGTISSSNTITMDISWISVSKNYVLTLKGNKSTKVITVTLPKQVTNFKAAYNKVKSKVTFSHAGTRTVEWRKKGSSIWNTVQTSSLSTQLSYLYNNGAVVYFRLAPVNGTGISDVGMRASKEVSVTIPKRASAPSITIDGSKFSIAVKKGMAYRTVDSDGSVSDWISITSTTDLLLKNIASKAMYTDASTAQSKVTLQFRTNATNSSQVSKITTVTVPVQEGPPSISSYGISLTYTSSSTLSLRVKAASSTEPFEYTIVDQEDSLNYQTADWTAISSSTAVSLDDEDAPAGSHIYIRKKSIAETDDTDFELASDDVDVAGTNGVEYPNAPSATTLTTLISTAGVCRTSDSSSFLTFKLYSPTSTTVSAIQFDDAYGIAKGSVTCKSTVAKNTNSTGENDKYIITTKITSTSSIDSVTDELLYADITLADSDVIISTDKAGVRLYLYPASAVNNPTDTDDADEYMTSFQRVYMSDDKDDDTSFKFRLDLGTTYLPDYSAINGLTSTPVQIQTIKYDGYSLVNGSDYTVVYGSYVNDDDETIATATVTVNAANFEESSLIDDTGTKLPLIITLNNGEKLDDDVYMTLVNTATLNDTPIAWSMTEGSLKETKTSTTTNTDGSTTTTTEEVNTYTLTLTLFDKSYGVGVADVTWDGKSVLGSTSISGGTATIYLSNAKLNDLTTDSSKTENLIITLSNGFVIKSGCKLTVLNAS